MDVLRVGIFKSLAGAVTAVVGKIGLLGVTVVGAIAPGIVASIYLIHTYGIDTILEFLAGAMLKLGDLIITGLEIAGSIIKGITN